MNKAIRVGFVSLGCPKNQLDTEVMLGHLVKEGYEITPEETEADIIIINTCAFLESARKEAVEEVHMVVEGVNTAKAAKALADKYGVDMPILEEINKVLFEDKNAREAVLSLMMREGRNEGI